MAIPSTSTSPSLPVEFKGNTAQFGPLCKSGHCSEQGRRPTMEDTYVAIDDLNSQFKLTKDKHRAFYGVYDGHGGRNAADMAKEHVHTLIVKDKSFGQGLIDDAITKGFKAADKLIMEKATKENWTDGATAVTVMVLGNTLFVGNLGDAEAVLQQKTTDGTLKATCISFKHKPTDAAEKTRVEAAGGRIFLGRLLGTLAVSRAFGDVEFKLPQNKGAADFVSTDPFLAKININPENHFLIIACDGLWDKVDYQEAVTVCDQVKCAGKDPTQAAATLVKLALDKGTLHNVTCLVVYLDWNGKKKP